MVIIERKKADKKSKKIFNCGEFLFVKKKTTVKFFLIREIWNS